MRRTLRFTRRLAAAGMPRGRAEALAGSMADRRAGALATRRDLAGLEARLTCRGAVATLALALLYVAVELLV